MTTNKNIPGLPIKFQVGKTKQDGGLQTVRALGPGLEGGTVGQKGKNGQLVKLYEIQFAMSYYAHAVDVLDINNNDRFGCANLINNQTNSSSYARAKSIEHLPNKNNFNKYFDQQPIQTTYSSFSQQHDFQHQQQNSYFNESSRANNNLNSFTKSTSNLNEKERRRRFFLFNNEN